MTQGWRRFDWKNVVKPQKKDLAYSPENGLVIAGKALRPNGKATEKVMNVTLFVKKAKNPMMMALADESGKFRFEGMDFTDTSEVVIQAVRGKSIHSATISLDTWTKPQIKIIQVPFNPIEINEADYQDFRRMSQEMYAFEKELRFQNQLLNQVNVKAKKNEVQPTDPRRIYGKENVRISVKVTNEMCNGITNPFDLLLGRVPGLGQIYVSAGDNSQSRKGPFCLIDGVPVGFSYILSLNVRDIQEIDVLQDATLGIYGLSAGFSSVGYNFITRTGPSEDATQGKDYGRIFQKLLGYASPKAFYHPKYDILQAITRPDYRSTLYWNPSIKTDINGKASVSFWASDNKGSININLQGNTAKGTLGLGTCKVEVK